MEKKSEYKALINELNQLSENFPATKDRMVEIAHILVSYYMGGKTVKDAEKKSAEDDLESIA